MDIAGTALWFIVLTIGTIMLGAAMIYAITRNRHRSLSDRVTTEVETRHEYEREDSDSR